MPDDNSKSIKNTGADTAGDTNDNAQARRNGEKPAKEIGGTDGPDPTRYGDWEKDGRCIDF
ncbi:MAG: DUF1674 domain-containing protein [Woeseiaceae bacterium]